MNLNPSSIDDPRSDQCNVLEYRRTFAAKRERVFAAWTDAKLLKQWWGPPESITRSVEVDLRINGTYRFEMQYPPGEPFSIYGVYHAIERPQKLVFTWRCDSPEMDIGDSLVTINFQTHSSGTEVILTHDKIPTKEMYLHFNRGWHEEFEKLADFLDKKGNE